MVNDMAKKKTKTKTDVSTDENSGKSRFLFHCTQCGWCCENRGPIPITFWDLEMWAKNGVVDNFIPYLKIYRTMKGGYDLILSPLKFDVYKPYLEKQQEMYKKQMEKTESGENKKKSSNEDLEKEEKKEPVEPHIDEKRCPLFNLEKRECLVYQYRPLSCRTYPLEYDGGGFNVIDEDKCEGIGQGPMTKEELAEMRDDAKLAFAQIKTMQISIPVLFNVIRQDLIFRQGMHTEFLFEMMQQQQKAMENMDPEDRKKLDEILSRNQPKESEEEDPSTEN